MTDATQPEDASAKVEETKELTEEEKKKKEEEEKKAAVEAEPDSQDLKNPSRILKAQEKKIQYKKDG